MDNRMESGMENVMITYEDNVRLCCERFSKKLEEAFVFEVRKAEAFLPHKNLLAGVEPKQEDIQAEYDTLLELFIEYSMGTSAAVLSTFGSTDPRFEAVVVGVLREKFKWLRDNAKQQKKG